MCGKNTPDHIFVDADSERFVDLLRDAWASEPWIASFQFDDHLDEFPRGTLGARLSLAAR